VLVSALEHRAGYCVFVYEPKGGYRQLPIGVLRRLYRLTPAEAHLANALFQGKSFAQAAEARGISINTAKYTLKSIFSKCEVSSRAELLLLLSLGPRTP
jgi:DNA-binding CsgD family transcriptional regulator